MQSPSMASTGTPERTPARDSDAGAEHGKRSATSAPAAGPASKRPRYDGKAFNELTLSELESIVREATELKRQVASRDEEIVKLKEVVDGKSALAKQVKSLEAELAAKQKEAEKIQCAVREQSKDVSVEAERVKRALHHQLASQMFWHTGLRDQLQGSGREIVAFAPNVSLEVLKALGAEHGSKTKYADAFFEALPAKTAPNGQKMVLARNMTVKYVKASCELRIDATYRFADATRTQKKKQAKKAPQKKRVSKSKSEQGADEPEDDDEGDEEEDGEGEEEGDGETEGEGAPEAHALPVVG